MSIVETLTLPSNFAEQTYRGRPQKSNVHSHPSGLDSKMSYHRGGHAQPWTFAPANPITSPPSASPFSPTHHARPARGASEIIPRLFISDLAFAENPALLSSHRITHILTTMPDTIFRPPPSLLPIQPARMQIRIEDMPFSELVAHLPSATAWIRDALNSNPEARVLVHCAEGISRSVSVVAAFLMAQYGWAPMEAIHYIKSKRRVADPNFGFIQQLHEYARDVLGRPITTPSHPFAAPT